MKSIRTNPIREYRSELNAWTVVMLFIGASVLFAAGFLVGLVAGAAS